MSREVAHQLSFEKALYSISPNFPPGKIQGTRNFPPPTSKCPKVRAAQRGPWNSDANFIFVETPFPAVDGKDGTAQVELEEAEAEAVEAFAARGASDPTSDPTTGAELGMADDLEKEEK